MAGDTVGERARILGRKRQAFECAPALSDGLGHLVAQAVCEQTRLLAVPAGLRDQVPRGPEGAFVRGDLVEPNAM